MARVEYWLYTASDDYWLRANLPTNRVATSTVASKGFPALWRKAPEGNYSLVAVAVDNEGATSVSDPIPFSVVPPNDNFENAQILSGSFVTVTNSTTAATLQVGEPAHTNILNPNSTWGSVWYSWTAPVSGWAYISCERSPMAAVDVYEGGNLTNLIQIRNDYSEAVQFQTVAGNTYYIAGTAPYGDFILDITLSTVVLTNPTDGAHFAYGAAIPVSLTSTTNEGQITFAAFWDFGRHLALLTNSPYTFLWTNAAPGNHDIAGAVLTSNHGYIFAHGSASITISPPNDDFAHRQTITNVDAFLGTFLGGATAEAGEPPPTSVATNSVWLSWTAPSSGVVTLFGGNIEHYIFDIFTGDSLSNLVLLTNAINSVTFDAVPGETYSLRISGSGYQDNVVFRFFLSSFEITSPLPGAQFTAGTHIPITVGFTERDEPYRPIQNVKFYANDVPIGTIYDLPFSFVWSNVVAGSYELRAVGTNNVDFLSHSSVPVLITVLPP